MRHAHPSGVLAAVCALLAAAMLPVPVSASTITFVQTAVLGGPAHATVYPSGVALSADGSVVVADTGNEQIAKFDGAGNQLWRVGQYGSGDLQFAQPRDVGVDSAGNIYVADDGNNRVDKLDPNGNWITSWSGPSADPVGSPIGIGVRNDVVYVADPNHNRVHVFDTSGNQLLAFGSQGVCVMNRLRDVDADQAGNVYVANYTTDDILKFTSAGTCVSIWGKKGTAPGQFLNPYGIATGFDPVLAQEAVYVADSNNQRIQEFGLDGTFVTMFGSAGSTPGTFTQLRRVATATDGSGDVWGADLWGYRVERFTRGAGGYSYGQTIGGTPPPLDATHAFNQVREVAFESSGNIVAADTVNQRIVRMGSDGSTLNACGIRGFADPGEFNWPQGVAVDQSTGQIWIADTKQSDIQVLNADCSVVDQFGQLGSGITAFNLPSSITIRQSDRIAWIADTNNNRIVSYDVATRTAIAAFGSKGSGSGQFNQPNGIAIDAANGHVLVADTANNRIVELSDSAGSGIAVVRTLSDAFKRPQGVAGDLHGNIAVADSLKNRVVVLAPDGSELASLTNSFYQPQSVAFDVAGHLYVSDTYNDRIVVYTPNTVTSRTPIYNDDLLQAGQASMYPVDVAHSATYFYVLDPGRFRVDAVNRSTGAIDFSVGGVQGAGPGQFGNARAIATDSTGNVYVADTPNNRIEKFDASLNFIAAWGKNGSGPGQFNQVYGVAAGTGLDASGHEAEILYAVDGAGRIEKFALDGTYIGLFGNAALNQPRQVVVHPVTHTVYVVNSGAMQVIAFDESGSQLFTFGSKGTGGGQFTNEPRGISLTSDGARVFVTDSGLARVEAFDSTGTYLYQVGSSGTGPGQFTAPRGSTVTEDGLLVVVDQWDFSIKIFQDDGTFVQKLFGVPPPVPGTNSPRGIRVDAGGALVAVDYWNQRIEKINVDGSNPVAFGFRGSRTTAAALNYAWDVAVQPGTGRLFVANRESYNIVVFNADGSFVTSWGTRGSGPGQLNFPQGLNFAPDGTLVVSDSGNGRLNRYSVDAGGKGTFMASYGRKGSSISGPGYLNTPTGVDVAADGTIWVADTVNNSIQSLSSTGVWTRFSKATGQPFLVPWGVTVAPDGTIWVADTGNNRVVQMSVSGTVLVTASGTAMGSGPLSGPSSIAFGPNNHIYIADTWNNRVIDATLPS